MNEPDKPKLTDYLTEALAKSLTRGGASEPPRGARTRGGRGAAGAGWRLSRSRRDLWTLRRLGRKPRRLLRYAQNHGPTRFSRSRYPSGSIQLGRPAGSPSGESSTLTKTCRRMGNCPYSRLPAPEGPRVPLLELVDRYGVPTMAQGRGAPLELAVYIGACILTPHRVRVSRGRLVTTVRELRDFLFGPTWRPGPIGNRPGDWERVRAAALNASDLWLPLENGDLWRAVAVRKIPPADYRPEYLDRQGDLRRGVARRGGPWPGDRPAGAGAVAAGVRAEVSGRTSRRIPSPGGRALPADATPRNRSVHLWSSDPAHYPVLTAEARRRLAFGSEDKKNRTRANQDEAVQARTPVAMSWSLARELGYHPGDGEPSGPSLSQGP